MLLVFQVNMYVNEKTFTGMSLYYCGIIGLVITGLLIWITEYYTGTEYRPVKSIAAYHQQLVMEQMLFKD